MTYTHARRIRGRLSALTGLALLAFGCWLAPTPARGATTFTATAGGEITRVGVRVEPGLIVEQLLDPGASVAQVSLNSLGESVGFAANPFPGDLAGQFPSLFDGLSGGQTDLPEYPLVAATRFPSTPDAQVQAGPMLLQARSRVDDTRAEVIDGGNQTVASAAVGSDDLVTARAEVTVGGLTLGGGVLELDGVRSFAEVRRSTDGAIVRTTDFSVARMSVLGQSFGFSSEGITVLGSALPLGVDGAALLTPLLAQLADQQRIAVRIIEPTETEDGVVSGGIEIDLPTEVPSVGTVIATLTLGRANASVTNRARAGVIPARPVSAGGVPAVAGAGASLSAPAVTGAAPRPGTATVGAPTRVVAQPAATPLSTTASASIADRTRISYFYPVLLVLGGALMLGATLFRHFAVRLAWTS